MKKHRSIAVCTRCSEYIVIKGYSLSYKKDKKYVNLQSCKLYRSPNKKIDGRSVGKTVRDMIDDRFFKVPVPDNCPYKLEHMVIRREKKIEHM